MKNYLKIIWEGNIYFINKELDEIDISFRKSQLMAYADVVICRNTRQIIKCRNDLASVISYGLEADFEEYKKNENHKDVINRLMGNFT